MRGWGGGKEGLEFLKHIAEANPGGILRDNESPVQILPPDTFHTPLHGNCCKTVIRSVPLNLLSQRDFILIGGLFLQVFFPLHFVSIPIFLGVKINDHTAGALTMTMSIRVR